MAIIGSKKSGMIRALQVLLAASVLVPVPVLAEEAAAPSESAMVNLVRALVARGTLTQDIGDELIRQAETEAARARSASQQASAGSELPPAPNGAIRVPYIPESVRAQIKDELRGEVMKEARQANWASPDQAAPEWTRRITLHGDIRARSQSELYSKTNANDIIDFATINAFGPYGIDDPRLLLPILNSRNDRWNQARLRARLGVEAQVTKGVSAGITIATGDNAGPISTNASLGGGFFKRDLWLDRAWISIEPTAWTKVTLGRLENPFSSSDLLYDTDLNLDGAAVELNSGTMLGDDLKVALRGGAFPIDFGSSNSPIFAFNKPKAPQKYLFAGELGVIGKLSDIGFALSAGYHVFNNFQGDLSAPCQVETESFCSTDSLQPLFLTKGNTLSPLRQIVTIDPNADLPQLLGYTFAYRILDANASVTIPLNDALNVELKGSYVRNLGFDSADICRNGLAGRPYNNDGPGGLTYCAATNPAQFVGGDTGYRFEARLGQSRPHRKGEWNVFAGYRYLESDAVLDALTDSDFHLGGTNSKGYLVGGKYAFLPGVVLGGRWMSANEISGPPLAIDVLQVDLEVSF